MPKFHCPLNIYVLKRDLDFDANGDFIKIMIIYIKCSIVGGKKVLFQK